MIRTMARGLALVAMVLAMAGCAAGTAPPQYSSMAGARPVNPFYGVPGSMMRSDGTMINGLLPINPDDQS